MSERVQDDGKNTQDEGASRLAWFLTGAIIGATAVLLYAPRSGKDTRRLLSDTTQRSKETIAGTGKDLLEAGKDVFERGRKLVEDAAELFERGRRLVKG